MEGKLIFLDTSILIDYFRKKQKEKTIFYKLAQKNSSFAISVITEFEILIGCNLQQRAFWRDVFNDIKILPLDRSTVQLADELFKSLKTKNKRLDFPDLFIAATAIEHSADLATLNIKHFSRIDELKLLDINEIK